MCVCVCYVTRICVICETKTILQLTCKIISLKEDNNYYIHSIWKMIFYSVNIRNRGIAILIILLWYLLLLSLCSDLLKGNTISKVELNQGMWMTRGMCFRLLSLLLFMLCTVYQCMFEGSVNKVFWKSVMLHQQLNVLEYNDDQY